MTTVAKHKSQTPLFLRLLALLATLALTACGANTIVLGGNYPAPLARKIPLNVGIYYPPELRNYVYTEIDDDTGKDQYIVQGGASQLQLFNAVLPSLFQRVVMLDTPEQAGAQGVDAVFTPSLAEFQLGLPQKTRLKVFEVWLKYNMKLSKPGGEQIADWVMTAYGKSPEESLQSVDAGVKAAATVAMRDLAASLTLGFANVPDVKEWLRANHHEPQ